MRNLKNIGCATENCRATRLRIAAASFCALVIAGCATAPSAPPVAASGDVKTSRETPWQWTPLSSSGGSAGGNVRNDLASKDIKLPGYQPIRRTQDFYTYGEKNVPVVVEHGWDYDNGVARETVFDLATGKVISKTDKPGATLNVSDQEVELAIALLREDARLKDLLSTPKLNFYAGFSYRDATDPPCYERSRCVHVIVSAGDDGQRHIAHSIVDLATRRVIHPFYEPDRIPQPITSN